MASEREHNELVADLRGILAEAVESEVASLTEEDTGSSLERKAREQRKKKATKHLGSGRNPFRHKSDHEPGPRNCRPSGKCKKKSNKWKCNCSKPYQCKCKSGSRTKIIRIGRAYKKTYNAEFKRFRKGQHKAQG